MAPLKANTHSGNSASLRIKKKKIELKNTRKMYQIGRSERCIYKVSISGALDSTLQVKYTLFFHVSPKFLDILVCDNERLMCLQDKLWNGDWYIIWSPLNHIWFIPDYCLEKSKNIFFFIKTFQLFIHLNQPFWAFSPSYRKYRQFFSRTDRHKKDFF